MKKVGIIVGVLLLVGAYSANSQTIHSNAVGNWNQPATWIGGVIPGATNDVVIHHAVTISNAQFANSVTIINDAAQTASLAVTGGSSIIGAGGITVTGGANAFASDLLLIGGSLSVNGSVSFVNSIAGNNASALRVNSGSQLTIAGDFSYMYQPTDAALETRTEVSIANNSVLSVGNDLNLTYNSATKNSSLTFFLENSAALNVAGDVSLITSEGGAVAGNTRITFALGLNTVASTATARIGGNVGLYIFDLSAPFSNNRNIFELRDNTRVDIYGDLIFNAQAVAVPAVNRSNRVRIRDLSRLTLGSSNLVDPFYDPLGGDVDFASGNGSLNDNRIELSENGTFDINANVIRPDQGQIESADLSSIIFSGNIAQQIFRVQPNFINLTIDNSSGVALTLATTTIVSRNLDMVNGIINTVSPNRFFLSTTASCTGGTATSYIINGVTKIGSGAITLPLGDGAHWAPIELSNIIGANDNLTGFEARYFLGSHPVVLTDGTFDHRDGAEYWQLQLVSVSGNPIFSPTSIDATFHWKDACFSEIENLTIAPQDLFMGGLVPATRWELIGNSTIVGGSQACNNVDVVPETGSIRAALTTANLTTYTHYTFVALTPFLNPLPVELTSFGVSATRAGEALIIWETSSEMNNWKFVVEKSYDGLNWNAVAEVEGNGTTSIRKNYHVIDSNPYAGVSYYRLAQYDFDGTLNYSYIRSFTISGESKLIVNVYPNPTRESLRISTTNFLDQVEVNLFDGRGTCMMSHSFSEFGRNQTLDVQSLVSGRYLLTISQNGKRLDSKQVFIIK